MCYSGCRWEVKGMGENAGECRKPGHVRCQESEDEQNDLEPAQEEDVET